MPFILFDRIFCALGQKMEPGAPPAPAPSDGFVIIACPRPPVKPEMKNQIEITANLRSFQRGFPD
jgi:hypothetical protein